MKVMFKAVHPMGSEMMFYDWSLSSVDAPQQHFGVKKPIGPLVGLTLAMDTYFCSDKM